MKNKALITTKGIKTVILVAGVVVAATGCVERRVVYVPAYRTGPSPVYPAQPAYQYPPQTVYQASPPAGMSPWTTNAPLVSNAPPPQPAPAGPAMTTEAPPPPQLEVVPMAPGPDYYGVPGYWNWNGGWVWIGGNWLIRPWHGAVWVGGGWARHGRRNVWVGGHWH